MKKILTLGIILFFGLQVKAQDTVYVEVTDWAGGVCCSGGQKFSVQFKVARPGFKVDSMELNIDGMGYRVPCLQSMEISPDYYSYNFEISHSGIEGYKNENVYYSGIEAKNVFKIDPPYELLRIYYSNGKIRNAPIVITRRMIAYP